MELNLKGKVAIITGGGTGIGKGAAEALAGEGVNVIINYIVDEADVIEQVNGLNEKYNTDNWYCYADVSKPSDVDEMIKKVDEKYGHIDIVINAAGIWPTNDFDQMPDEVWEKVVNVNLNGTFYVSKRIVNYYKERNIKGRILNVTSKSAYICSTPQHAHYVATKGGVSLLTRAVAREVSKDGIIVNCIIPGIVRTKLNEEKLKNPEAVKEYESRIPIGRIAYPIDIAYIMAFLVSEKADFTAGACIDATGGMLC